MIPIHTVELLSVMDQVNRGLLTAEPVGEWAPRAVVAFEVSNHWVIRAMTTRDGIAYVLHAAAPTRGGWCAAAVSVDDERLVDALCDRASREHRSEWGLPS